MNSFNHSKFPNIPNSEEKKTKKNHDCKTKDDTKHQLSTYFLDEQGIQLSKNLKQSNTTKKN